MIDNPVSINGIKEILSKFSEGDVLTLCGTVTQGLLKNKIRHKEDAMECIVKHSANESSLLKRKIITRTHLFEYLHDLGVAVTVPFTKDELVDKITKIWSENAQIATIANNTSNQLDGELTTNIESSHVEIHGNLTENTLEVMAKQFADWFYGLMNKSDRIGSEHFFPDACLNIHLINNETSIQKQALNSANEVSNLLYNTRQEYNLFFHPNLLPDGTSARLDQHGLVLVMSCGTLHINATVAGVFEQIFGLARDPFSADNWKIKNSTLTLRNKPNVHCTPCLQETELLTIENM